MKKKKSKKNPTYKYGENQRCNKMHSKLGFECGYCYMRKDHSGSHSCDVCGASF
jgi:hypothetical protein